MLFFVIVLVPGCSQDKIITCVQVIFGHFLRQDGRWQLVHEEKSDAFQINEGVWNNFAVRVIGQRFTAYVNDIELFTFEDNSIRGIGEIGVGLSGESQKSAIARFDNFVIAK